MFVTKASLGERIDEVLGTSLATQTAINGVTILKGAVDPSADTGVAATVPALYFRTGTEEVYLKIGDTATDWSRVALASELAP